MTIQEFCEEKRGTYDKFYTMYEVCKSLSFVDLNVDPIQAIREVCKLFMEHPLYGEGVIDVSVSYGDPFEGDCRLDEESLNFFVYDLEEFVDPLSGEIVKPSMNKLDVRFIIKKFAEDSEENILAQELDKCRSLSYFYNNYVKLDVQADVSDEDIQNLIKNTLKLRGRL